MLIKQKQIENLIEDLATGKSAYQLSLTANKTANEAKDLANNLSNSIIKGYFVSSGSGEDGDFYADSNHANVINPEYNKLYIDLHTSSVYHYSELDNEYKKLTDIEKLLSAYSHSISSHAPSNAEKNTIIGLQKNGTDLSIDSNRKVNITVPTKVSELTNDVGFSTNSYTSGEGIDITNDKISLKEYGSASTYGLNEDIEINLTDEETSPISIPYIKSDKYGRITSDSTINVLTINPLKNATSTANGLMSSTDKNDLDTLLNSPGYNLVSNINWYDTNHTAYNYQGKNLYFDGMDIYITDNSGIFYHSSEIATMDDLPTIVDHNGEGLMSADDKIKLDGIATNANNYVHPTTAGNRHIPSGGSSGQILKWSSSGTAVWGNEKTYSNATTSTAGLMSADDKTTLNNLPSDFLKSIKENAPMEFTIDEYLELSNVNLTGDVSLNSTKHSNYATLAEVTDDISFIMSKYADNTFDFIFNMLHNTTDNDFKYTSSEPLYISTGTNKTGKWYYDGNEIATKSDIPSTSDFLKTSGGTMTGTYTLTSGYSINSSYNSNLKLIRVNSNYNYFGEQTAANTMYNFFGYRNNANTTTLTNYFGVSYSSSYKSGLTNYFGRYAYYNYIGDESTYNYVGRNSTNNYIGYQTSSTSMTNYFGYRNSSITTSMTNYFGGSYSSSYISNLSNYFGRYATYNYFGDGSTTSYYRGNTIYLGSSTSYPVYLQGSTSYRVVGTTTGYNTKVHVASSQPSSMSVGDIWFKIPS